MTRSRTTTIESPTPGDFTPPRAVPALGCGCGCGPPRSRRGLARPWPLLPAVALVLLPKCPLCFAAASLGAVGVARLAAWLAPVWGMPLALGLLGLTTAALAARAVRRRDWRPAIGGLLGAGLLLAGKAAAGSPALLGAGLIVLAGAACWDGRPAAAAAPRRGQDRPITT